MKRIILGLVLTTSFSALANDCSVEVAAVKTEIKKVKADSKDMIRHYQKVSNYFYDVGGRIPRGCTQGDLGYALRVTGGNISDYVTEMDKSAEKNFSAIEVAFDNLDKCLAK